MKTTWHSAGLAQTLFSLPLQFLHDLAEFLDCKSRISLRRRVPYNFPYGNTYKAHKENYHWPWTIMWSLRNSVPVQQFWKWNRLPFGCTHSYTSQQSAGVFVPARRSSRVEPKRQTGCMQRAGAHSHGLPGTLGSLGTESGGHGASSSSSISPQ